MKGKREWSAWKIRRGLVLVRAKEKKKQKFDREMAGDRNHGWWCDFGCRTAEMAFCRQVLEQPATGPWVGHNLYG